ncbi:MAG: FAD-binding oxidoreductase [Myxococcota bacterium]
MSHDFRSALDPARRMLGRWLTRHRGLVVGLTALPASFVWDRTRVLRDWFHERFVSDPSRHEARVRDVQAQVRRWQQAGADRPMVTARPEWKTMSSRTATYKKDYAKITLDLRDILELDEEKRTVRVEPLVNMGQLTRFLVPRGWALKTMVEMEDLTAGGLSMGLGMETMAHRFGLWQETVRSYELVTADGERRTVTASSDPELFHALPWSHGTLGFLTAVELEVVPVEPHVRMTYLPFHSLEALHAKLDELACRDDAPDFLEATLYSRTSGVIQCGWFDGPPADPSRINPIGRWHAPWYFEHVGSTLERGELTEWIPLRHYYHRHTKAIFWEIRHLLPFANHPAYRWLLGWLGAPKVAFLKKTMTEGVRKNLVHKHVAQDLLVPLRHLPEAVELSHERFGVYPLLVFPIRVYDHGDHQGLLRRPKQLRPGKDWDMYCDLGIYGVPAAVRRGEPWDAVSSVRALEAFARETGGCTLPWADLFMTRQEFEQMFDHTLYRRVRERVGAVGAFPEVWDKVKPQHSLSAEENEQALEEGTPWQPSRPVAP